MKTIERIGATAVAVVLVAPIAGCSTGSPNATLVATTAPVTSAATSAPSGRDTRTPATPRPLSDFYDDEHGPEYSFYSFGTPSAQIQCRVVAGTLACQTEGRSHTVASSALCGFYPGVEQGNTRRFGYFPEGPCATIIQGGIPVAAHTGLWPERDRRAVAGALDHLHVGREGTDLHPS